MSFQIRAAQKEDLRLVLELILELAVYEKLAHEVTATEAILEESFFNTPGGPKCLIGLEGQTPVGFCIYFHNFSSFIGKQGIYLEDLFVRPEFRGKSYGKLLLLELVKIAKEKGLGRVEWSVLDWNTPAIDFYKSLGAQDMNEWTVYRLNRSTIEKLV